MARRFRAGAADLDLPAVAILKKRRRSQIRMKTRQIRNSLTLACYSL
jgi:hypothetical protein